MDPRTATNQTLLAHLVGKRLWTRVDFCREYAHTAQQIFGERREVTPQTVSRWLHGKVVGLPHQAQQQVLQTMFNVAPARLFEPATATRPTAAPLEGRPHDPHEVELAAAESAELLMALERAHVGPLTVEQLAADLRRIVTVYPHQPVGPLFKELRELHRRVFKLLDGYQPPRESRDLYRTAAAVGGVLANASFDLGNLPAAETQARLAYLCARDADDNELLAWIRGTQSLIAYWDGRLHDAVDLAAAGAHHVPTQGTAGIRLAAIEARAHGQLGSRAGVNDALARAHIARDSVTGDDTYGGMMKFPPAKLAFYSATSRLWLGDPQSAERDAANAVAAYQSARPDDRRLGEENLARLDLALARLHKTRPTPELDGAAVEIRRVLDVSTQRPTDSVSRRLRQVAATLAQPPYRGAHLAATLAEEISEHTNQTPPAISASGQDR